MVTGLTIPGLYDQWVKMPTSDTPVHPLIQERYPRFEGAVGDIDGTHIPIKVPALLADENRNRKGVVTTNFLAICDFNFKFVYLLPGFSGSVHTHEFSVRPSCTSVSHALQVVTTSET